MTPSLQIQSALKRLERARAYLELIKECKERNRHHNRNAIQLDANWRNDVFDFRNWHRKMATRTEVLHRYLIDRYNNTVAESLIIAPHMIYEA